MDTESRLAWLRRPEALTTAVFGSLTLGLAPFAPEPHVVGKLRWVLGGGVGMQPIDYADFVFHGAPWLLLVAVIAARIAGRFVSSRPA